MNRKERTLILNSLTYTKSPSYWGIGNVKNYLRELQKEYKEVFITITPIELRDRIFQWIDKCDPKLEKFLQFNKTIELEKGKICQLYEIPLALVNEIDDVLDKQQELPYDALNAGTWEHPKLVYSSKKGNLVEMWYAVKASRHATKAFDFDALSEDIQDELTSVLKKSVPDMDELERIRLEYNIIGRIINIITFDTAQKRVSISTDQPKLVDPDDTEKNVTRPEDRLGPLFERVCDFLGIQKNNAKSIVIQKRVNINSVKQIKVKETKELLLFPFRFDIIYKAGDLTAANVTRFPKLTTKNILPIVEEYYKTCNTFKGFFKAYSNFDAQKNSELLQTITNLPDAEDEAEGFFLFIVINTEIHVARIICNITTGSLRIIVEKGKGSYEHIATELDKIFS